MASRLVSWSLIAGAFLLRLGLVQLNLYRSTDFEVHRNWLSITHSLPISEWYFEATSPWTLDYPPAFAYFEWLLSQVAVLFDPAMLQVNNLEYASWATIQFQRHSVIAADLLLMVGGLALGGPETAAALLWNSALILVDHIHFQYNGMMLGLLLLSVTAVESGRTYLGAFLFCTLLCMKHIFLYVGPVYFIYLLRSHCGACFQPPRLFIWPLMKLATTVVGTFLVLLSPFLSLAQLQQIGQRLFPFGRGLTHAYWAPNCWALYNTLDRVLAKVMGKSSGSSSTAGFAEVYESAVLWTIPPRVTFLLTLLAYCPLILAIWTRTGPAPLPAVADKGSFATYVALGSAVAFAFGWHVHEKAILMVTIPLLAACTSGRPSNSLVSSYLVLSFVASFSVMPLLPNEPLETGLKWILLLAGGLVEVQLLGGSRLLGMRTLPWILLAAFFALLGAYRDLGGHRLLFRDRMEFLPLLLTSDFSAVLVLGAFGNVFSMLRSGSNGSRNKQHSA